MKKLLIIGDSFVVAYGPNKEHSWVYKLKEHFLVTNLAVSGSGVYWSYQKFLEHYEKDYDLIIWAVSDPMRGYIPDTKTDIPTLSHFSPMYCDKQFLHQLMQKGEKIPPSNVLVYECLDSYYYVLDEKKEYTTASLMIEDAKRKKPDMLILGCFGPYVKKHHSCKYARPDLFNNELALADLQFMEEDFWIQNQKISRKKLNKRLGHYDTRVCHLSIENNQMMYDKILGWTNTGEFTLTEDDWCEPYHHWKHYLKTELTDIDDLR